MRSMTMPEFLAYGLFDAGLFIGALDVSDWRHAESLPLVEDARSGRLLVCTTTGILSEVYAALTWQGATHPLTPPQAALAVQTLVRPPSRIRILPDSLDAALKSLEMSGAHALTALRVHDARHAAAALAGGSGPDGGCHRRVYLRCGDWKAFAGDGLAIVGPASALHRLSGV